MCSAWILPFPNARTFADNNVCGIVEYEFLMKGSRLFTEIFGSNLKMI
jgi:hypothetical protein